jgi:hypothetical protein
MTKLRKISIALLSISCILGLVRGYRMARFGDGAVLFPYPQDMIKVSVFSNNSLLGWIVFSLIGVFSLFVITCIVRGVRNYAYLIIVEGIFLSFLTLAHILVSGFALIHFFILILCVSIFITAIMQVPKEF